MQFVTSSKSTLGTSTPGKSSKLHGLVMLRRLKTSHRGGDPVPDKSLSHDRQAAAAVRGPAATAPVFPDRSGAAETHDQQSGAPANAGAPLFQPCPVHQQVSVCCAPSKCPRPATPSTLHGDRRC